MGCVLQQGIVPIHHPKHFFRRIPEAMELYVGPPACCRRAWMGAETYLEPGRASFVFISELDIAFGDEAAQIIPQLRRILEHRGSRPRVIQVYYTCAYELIGTDYASLEEELAKAFEGIRFLCQPIHHLEMPVLNPDFERNELDRYRVLEGPLPTALDVVGIIGADIAVGQGGEIAAALEACGISTIIQPTSCTSYEEFLRLPASRLNIQVGISGRKVCQHLLNQYGTPWIHIPESYSTAELERAIHDICRELGSTAPDYSESFEYCKTRGRQVAELYRNHPMVVAEFFLLDSVDIALSLAQFGFPIAGVDLGFFGESDPQQLEELRSLFPDLTVINRMELGPFRFDPEVIIMGKRHIPMTTTERYFAPTVHDTPLGTHRILALLDELEAYAREELANG